MRWSKVRRSIGRSSCSIFEFVKVDKAKPLAGALPMVCASKVSDFSGKFTGRLVDSHVVESNTLEHLEK